MAKSPRQLPKLTSTVIVCAVVSIAAAVAPNRNSRPAGRVRAERSVTLDAGVATSVASGVCHGARTTTVTMSPASTVSEAASTGVLPWTAIQRVLASRREGRGLCGAEQGLERRAVAADDLNLDLRCTVPGATTAVPRNSYAYRAHERWPCRRG